MGQTAYDSRIIHQFADSLYRKADSIVAFYALVGLLPGALIALWGGMYNEGVALAGGIVLAIFFGALGALYGQTVAFDYRLKAQIALCQVQVEYNTRGLSQGHHAGYAQQQQGYAQQPQAYPPRVVV